MPTPTEIKIYRIAETKVNRPVAREWLKDLGAEEYPFPAPSQVTDQALLVSLAGKRCYKSFEVGLNPNITRIRESYADYFENILSSGHGSVLEHSTYTYAIENVSRVFSAEMNRHRAGWAISEGSLRFIRFDENIPYWLPDSIKPKAGDDPDLEERKAKTRDAFYRAFAHQEKIYAELIDIWEMNDTNKNFSYKKKITSCLRRIVGLGVSTGGVWTGNVRALRHVITMRCSPVAEEEMIHVFSRIAADIARDDPLLFGDFQQDEDGFWYPKYVKV
jgi:thymidylate synthase (FAD)